MMGIMRTTRGWVAAAVLSVALQPCLVCALEPEQPAVRSAETCHGTTHQVAAACSDVLDVDLTVAPTVPVGIPALPSTAPEVLLPLRSPGEGAVEPTAPADGPPLWLRHASLLV
jgi:hypothetical protein